LALGRSAVDRAAELRLDLLFWDEVRSSNTTSVMLIREGEVAMRGDELLFMSPVQLPDVELAFLGQLDGINYASVLVDVTEDFALPADCEWQPLRAVGVALNDRDAGLSVTAIALSNWHKNHQRCSRCGETTFVTNAGWVRQCPTDGSEHYPRTDTAVIMLIVDDADRLLIARQAIWKPCHFSVVAGFVEPGETFEAAVAREAFEEVGISVTDCHYLGSQPWPFPASLMVGFSARATNTNIKVDGVEIEEARWLSREELVVACESGEVQLPARVSIARRLIESWYGAELPNEWSRS